MRHDGEPDVVVIGAGAAGLAAAKTALSRGLKVVVLESKGRLGGRAWTDRLAKLSWDRGAHWLHHAEENAFAGYAETAGHHIERQPAESLLWSRGNWAEEAVRAGREDYFARAFAAIKESGASGKDVAASTVLPEGSRFRAMFDSWCAAISGVEPDRLSTLDDHRYRGGLSNWTIREGFGGLVARYGEGVPVQLETPARRVRWGGRSAVVETPRGDIACRAVIVTVSTNVLAAGALAFDPLLPGETEGAIAGLPLGHAEKVAFAFSRDVFGMPGPAQLHFEHDTLEAIRFQIRSFDRNLAVGYLAGRFAAHLEAEGARAMIAFAKEKLVEVFGSHIQRHLCGVATTHWSSDPHILGGYSSARPGKADSRQALRAPVGDRVFFAGEACSVNAYGTVHGAYETGVEAAERVARRLGRTPAGKGPDQSAGRSFGVTSNE